MSTSILSTKLYIPSLRPNIVLRPRLVERLNEGLHRKLTLITASAGFGKTTLVSELLSACSLPAAWLSLDEKDKTPARFLTYVCAALQTVGANTDGILASLQASQPLPIESILTVLLNEAAAIPHQFVLVLDDYHTIASKPVDDIIAFVLEHSPPQLHMIVAARENPHFPLGRLRARNQLTELRAGDLRFTYPEAEAFLSQTMGINLSTEEIAMLEARTEGWIAGLQLAALSLQGHQDGAGFIRSFTGSHHLIVDYLVEEVLQRQPARIQTFLLRTSMLDRMCGALCDAVLRKGGGEEGDTADSGQEYLEYLEHANLFIIPLDNERRWYRYHHLFADLLRNRLLRSMGEKGVAELHIRASEWYEGSGLEMEAFHHAAAASDVERAARLAEGEGMPLLFRGEMVPVMNWLHALPKKELDARPSLWVMYASGMLMTGQTAEVERKLLAAEQALEGKHLDDKSRDLIGHIAATRAAQAVSQHRAETILNESRRALQYLHPNNLPVRTATTWAQGYAYQLQGDRIAAGRAYAEALSSSRRIGHALIAIMATLGVGSIQESDNRLHEAAESYRSALKMAGNPPLPAACEAHLGLARIFYEWNDLDAAERHGQLSTQLAKQLENTDRVTAGEVFLARLRLARGGVNGAAEMLARADFLARRQHFVHLQPQIAAVHVLVLLQQDNLPEASIQAIKYELPICEARVHLARGDSAKAAAILEASRQQAEAKGLKDERLKTTVLLAAALHAHGQTFKAANMLQDALTIAEPGGFIRIFIDEGSRMEKLLRESAAQDMNSEYKAKLLALCNAEGLESKGKTEPRSDQNDQVLIEPLSERELEILGLIAQGFSNHEIGERLFLALSTVKGYNRNMFDKLQVKRRTEAVARARSLGLI